MIRYITFTASIVLLASSLLSAADPAPSDQGSDEAPLRLKKKNKPPLPVPGKDDLDKKPVPEDQPPVDERDAADKGGGANPVRDEDFQNALERIGKNMRLAEDRLDNKELGDGLRAIQGDIVKDLDAIIKGQQQQQQQQQSAGGSSAPTEPRDDQQSQGGGQSRRQQRQQVARGMRNQPPTSSGSSQVARGDPSSGGRAHGSGSQNNQMGPFPEHEPSGSASLQSDLTKDIRDAWGHLPETKRKELEDYARETGFMPKYDALIRKYYQTLSETSRRGSDGR